MFSRIFLLIIIHDVVDDGPGIKPSVGMGPDYELK